jgi:hypothetical protein
MHSSWFTHSIGAIRRLMWTSIVTWRSWKNTTGVLGHLALLIIRKSKSSPCCHRLHLICNPVFSSNAWKRTLLACWRSLSMRTLSLVCGGASTPTLSYNTHYQIIWVHQGSWNRNLLGFGECTRWAYFQLCHFHEDKDEELAHNSPATRGWYEDKVSMISIPSHMTELTTVGEMPVRGIVI